MRANSEYRAIARQALKNNWGTAAVITLCASFVHLLINLITLSITDDIESFRYASHCITPIVTLPLCWGFYTMFLYAVRGDQMKIGYLFVGYASNQVWATMLLKTLYTFLWSLLFIIPGIIKGWYSYGMTEFIIKDDPTISADAALNRSIKMMSGKKMDLFMLDLSFIGWILLSLLSFGIGFLWLAPYFHTARAAFYEDIKQEEEHLG